MQSITTSSEVLREAVSASTDEWRCIKSQGRQGVKRAFEEGGPRKGMIKLKKALAAYSREIKMKQEKQTKSDDIIIDSVVSTGNPKKRRR